MATRRSLVLLTPTEFGELLRMKPATVRNKLAQAGVEPQEQTGKQRRFDSLAALSALLDPGRLDLSAERARLAKQQADAQELKNAIARGELVPGDQVESWTVALLSGIRTRLLAVPTKVAQIVHGAKSPLEVEAILREHQTEALREIAEAAPLA